MNNVFRILAKPAKLAKVVTYGLCELRGLGVKNTTKQFVITYAETSGILVRCSEHYFLDKSIFLA